MSAMARTRGFDEQQALDGAMELFWDQGYGAASIDRLLDATDLSKSSFYETFGNKRDLLLATLERYQVHFIDVLIEPLRRQDAGRDEIVEVLRRTVAHALSPAGEKGCFVNNCLVEMGPHDAAVRDAARAVRDHLEDAFVAAVASGQRNGSIASREKPRALGRFLINTVSGINVAAKWRPGRPALDDIVRVALRPLD
jgi:TetR/AcrR family transcriptional regulator, transcriptional repressor for nem operon